MRLGEAAPNHQVANAGWCIVLDHFDFGDLASYLSGQPDSSYWAEHGAIALLGCDCGEVECRPFEGKVLEASLWRQALIEQHPGQYVSPAGC